MKEYPLVSVVVCTYNRAEYLDMCLDSLNRQSYPDYEIIVVNGPSTDGTDEVLEKYSDIRLVLQKELNGLSFARNLGIRVSTGEIVAFIDDDAVADINWIDRLVAGYTEPEVGGVGGLVYGPGRTHYQFDNGVIGKCGIPDAIRNPGRVAGKGEYPILMGTNCSFRRSALMEVGGFDPYFRYYHDESELCVRIIRAGYRIVYQRDASVVHYMVEGHNRRSPYDLNWSEIVKNVIYYTMKNFGNEFQSYSTRPAYSSYWWLRRFKDDYFGKQISFRELRGIYYKVLEGSLRGYRDGLSFNFASAKDKQDFISDIPEEMYEVREPPEENIVQQDAEIQQPPNMKDSERSSSLLKIAYISQEYSKDCGGGNCFHTRNLAHGFASLGHEVHVIALSETRRAHDYMDGNVYVHKVTPYPPDALGLNLTEDMHVSRKNIAFSYAAALKLIELKERSGIQIAEAPLWDAQGFVSSLVTPVPLVVRLVTPLSKFIEIQEMDVTKDLRLANWLEGETLRRADRLIAISNNIGALIKEQHRIGNGNIVYGPLGIEVPDEKLLNSRTASDELSILYVGRLEKRKGIDTLFKAMPKVLREIPNASFTVVGKDTDLAPGGGSYKKYLLKGTDKKYHKFISFTDFVTSEQLQEYYRNCDIFVAPSLYESFGQIYIEAMAWGKPVIGCNTGGIPEVIEDGRTGFVITPEDADELAERIIVLRDGELRKHMGMSGRESVENVFSVRNMVAQTYEVYRELV
ncbi:MAG: glycosyltransferase [Methanolobus sp.]|nr:glycosyltransferase [Methanolobus sp.]